jgi:hypothetical protein
VFLLRHRDSACLRTPRIRIEDTLETGSHTDALASRLKVGGDNDSGDVWLARRMGVRVRGEEWDVRGERSGRIEKRLQY